MRYLFILIVLSIGCSSNNKTTVEPECEPKGICTKTTPYSTLQDVHCKNDYWDVGPYTEAECLDSGYPDFPDEVFTWTEEFCDCESFCDDFVANNPGMVCGYTSVTPVED